MNAFTLVTVSTLVSISCFASCAREPSPPWHDLSPASQGGGGKADGPTDAELSYHGGPVISKLKVFAIYWGDGIANQTDFDAFYSAITKSEYMDWLSEYNTPTQTIGRGSFGTSIVDSQPLPGTTVSDAQIQAELTRLLDAGTLPANNSNNLYMFHFPDGVAITTSFGDSCSSFCAYHSTMVHSGHDAFYGVMPGCAQSCTTGSMTVFQSKTAAASHEMIEAVTDAEIGLFLEDNVDSHKAWVDPTYNEIGDICAWIVADFQGYTVQKEWSNKLHSCTVNGHDVVADFEVGAMPGAATVLPGGSTTIDLTSAVISGSLGDLAVSVSGLPAGVTATVTPASAPIGQNIAVEIKAASSATTGTTTVSVTATATATGGAPVTHQIALPLTVAAPGSVCMDGTALRPVVKPAPGQLVITEVMADPAGTDTSKEWFEITNTGWTAFDLNELGLKGTGSTPSVIHSSSCISIASGGFGLLARSSNSAVNGMLPPVDATFGFSLVNTAGSVSVLDGATVLDTATWTSAVSGASSALDPSHFTSDANDIAANWCPGTAPYGDNTSKGTPKAMNASCP